MVLMTVCSRRERAFFERRAEVFHDGG